MESTLRSSRRGFQTPLGWPVYSHEHPREGRWHSTAAQPAGLRSCQARGVRHNLRMSFTELSDGFFMKCAGWEAVKNARSLLAGGKVISSNWTPPLLKGVVQEGTSSYRAGLVIKG